ncbi:Peptidase M16 inactive domain protein [Microbulbifer aggregans]|uniref:Peptidase M16 inactive domain protein n=1 Tax=Microbulbifer aggregans TaxID=1769779 RepID=A0A1C9W4H9_9GAMM|nr:pitrilysin family protein [Microbulbifer aggregans]AOS96057.1 Peptidase M16 inactive domain protein [Microbulbifer aggregans]
MKTVRPFWIPAVLALALSGCGEPPQPGSNSGQASADTKSPLATSQTAITPLKIPYEKFTLDNGLRVIVHEDRKAPIVSVGIWYHVGSKDEKPGRTGFAHLFEHLMFNGSENYNDEFFKPFEAAGATGMNGTTWLDRTNYFETVPSNALDMALWMESDRMGHLLGAVTQEKLDEQRGVVQNEKRQGQNQPYGKVWEQMQKAIFPEGHPYSWTTIGSMEDLNAASLEDVHNWFKQYYGAANTVLVLAGDIDLETAKEKANKYFGDIPAGPPLIKKEAWIAKRDESKREKMFDRVAQSRIYKVWNAPYMGHEDSNALSLAAAVLGSGKNSRLYERLVYKDQIATSVETALYEFELASVLQVIADAKTGVELATVEAAIEEELARFMEEGPTEEELARVIMSEYAESARNLEQVGGWSGKGVILARGELYHGDPNALLVDIDEKQQLSPEQVRTAAKEWLASGDYNLEVRPFPEYKVASAGADRSELPDTGEFPSVPFPQLQTTELSNGLKVVLAERHAVPMVNMHLMFDAGYAADLGQTLGTAGYTMSMLKEGTSNFTALELDARQEMLGARIYANTQIDVSNVGLEALTSTLDESVALFADVVIRPTFAEEEIERKRTRWLAMIDQEKTRPVQMALRTLPPLLYGEDHAYGVPLTGSGTKESINALTREDLVRHHQTWIRPDNATMVVAGDITMDALTEKLEQHFADWRAPEAPMPQKNLAQVPLPAEARVFLIDKPDSEQSIIIGGLLDSSDRTTDSEALDMMNDILGGTFTSRINMNLREDKSWAYGAFSFLIDTKGQQPFLVYAPVQTDKTSESIKELQKELRGYIGTAPAEMAELQKVKDKRVNELPGRFETINAILGATREMVKYERPLDYMDGYADLIRNADLDTIHSLARETIKPDQFTWVIVGDKRKIADGIRDLDIAPIVEIDADGNLVEEADIASGQ